MVKDLVDVVYAALKLEISIQISSPVSIESSSWVLPAWKAASPAEGGGSWGGCEVAKMEDLGTTWSLGRFLDIQLSPRSSLSKVSSLQMRSCREWCHRLFPSWNPATPSTDPWRSLASSEHSNLIGQAASIPHCASSYHGHGDLCQFLHLPSLPSPYKAYDHGTMIQPNRAPFQVGTLLLSHQVGFQLLPL